MTRGEEAFVSQHLGDLDDPASVAIFEQAVEHLCTILEVEPRCIAHDLHPDIPSTRIALQLATERGLPTVAVQHHHAHVAAVLAEHRFQAPVLGVALDGVGLGEDGQAWGGELLHVDAAHYRRLGHLAPMPLPGGDRAAREPWRMAAAVLHRLGRGGEIRARFPRQRAARQLHELLDRELNCPLSSSAGRLFDAAAALLGVAENARFEAEPAMRLEALARIGTAVLDRSLWTIDSEGVLDLLPLLEALADWRGTPADGAALFHASFAAALVQWTARAAGALRVDTIALCGGCLLNGVLRDALAAGLGETGLRVLNPRLLPPNDGAISLGQAWVAIAKGGC